MQKLHVISGLPRSGSTLLAGLLRQNPRIHARMSSPLCPMFNALLHSMGGEGGGFVTEAQRARILRGLFENWCAGFPDKEVVFDTNRMWTARLPALLQVLPDVKVVCMVRNVAWIMDSIERATRRHPLLPSRLFGDGERATVYSRLEALAGPNRLVGGPWTALKEAFYGPQADSLLVIDYDYLAKAPGRVMDLLYDFIGEPRFAHDFDAVDYDEPEFDAALATPGLHRVAREVRFTPRRTVLPPDLFARFDKLSFWTDAAPSEANLIAPRRPAAVAEAAD